MKLNFRQGLISAQSPLFLSPAQGASDYVALIVSPTPLLATIAHGTADYLIKYDASVDLAWGPISGTADVYLYIDLNLLTGQTSFGVSARAPIVSTIEPTGVLAGQAWFDQNDSVFKLRSSDNTKWYVQPRVYVGTVLGGSMNQIVQRTLGATQANLSVECEPGYVMLDSQLRAIRTSQGTLLTDQTKIYVKTTNGTAGVLSEPATNFVPVRADEPIPEMSLVYFTGENSVSLASSDPSLVLLKTPIGIIESDLAQNELGVLTQTGEITYDQWAWSSSDFGKPLYCGYHGELTLTRPSSIQVYRVGYIKSRNSILFGIVSETQAQVIATEGSIISGQPPLTAITSTNANSEIVTTISINEATTSQDGYMTKEQALVVATIDTRLTSAETSIATLQTSKSNVGHTHAITDVAQLDTALNTINTALATKLEAVTGAVSGNIAIFNSSGFLVDSGVATSGFSTIGHTHQISDVINLQTALNAKANSTHTHSISDVSGLQNALDDKISFTNTLQFIPTSDYNPASKKYVDDAVAVASAGGATQLSQLTDVVDTISSDAVNGQFLRYNGSTGEWYPSSVPTTSMSLFDLTNVSDTIPSGTALLQYNPISSMWDAIETTSIGIQQLGRLSDVNDGVTDNMWTMADGLVLTFNNTTHEWEARQPATTSTPSLETVIVALGSSTPIA